MLRKILAVSIVGAAFGLFSAPVSAGLQDFTLQNATGYTFYHVYVSPASSNSWEEDILGETQVVNNGASLNIAMNGYANNVCMFDVKAVDNEGDSYEVRGVNLCTVSVVRVTLDHLQ